MRAALLRVLHSTEADAADSPGVRPAEELVSTLNLLRHLLGNIHPFPHPFIQIAFALGVLVLGVAQGPELCETWRVPSQCLQDA